MNLRTSIKCVILIQIRFCQLLWVLEGEKKIWEKTHFDIFRLTNCDFSMSNPISKKWNVLISTHPIVKMKIVLENLGSREDMVKNPFSILSFSPPEILVTLHLPWGGTMSSGPELNAKMVDYSMKTRTWTRKTTFDKNPKNFLRKIAKNQT